MKKLANLDEDSDELTCDTICSCGMSISFSDVLRSSHCTRSTFNRSLCF